MILKMFQITDFTTFFAKVKSQKLPFKTSYRITLLAQEIEKHINFYQEQFRSLLQEYGKKDEKGNLCPTEDGNGILLDEATMQEAYNKLTELQNLDVELPNTKFTLEDFGNIELTPEEIQVILPFIEE